MPGNAPDERSPLLGTAQGHQLDDTLANAKPALAVVDEISAPLAAAHTYDDAEDPGGNEYDQDRRNESETGKLSSAAILRVVVVLLVGAFMANLDGSLVLATHPVIASEFNALSLSSWLFVSFNLAGASTQAVYGKLSDTYGRRPMLMIAYTLFALGCFFVGAGRTMGEVIFGRVVSGCGGAALNVLGILVITDLVPLREAATWQSGVNLAATTGRSLGGPLGGWLADTIGWRWSFLSQVPVFAIAIAMSMAWLPAARARAAPSAAEHSQDESSGLASHQQNGKAPKVTGRGLARIDFLGAIFLALTILCLLFPIQMGGSKNFPWSHPAISGLAVATLLLGGLFVLVEENWAVEPILPMELLRQREVLLLYLVAGAQCAAQLGLMFSVPLYFQVTQRSSNAAAGGYLFPAVAGNAVGAIVGGLIVKRTGRYKSLMVGAGILSSISYLLLLLRWHGHTNIWEALYIIPGGLGTGLVQILVFVGIQATIDPSLRAPAMSCLFIVISVGATIGMAAANSVTMNVMKVKLEASLIHMGLGEAIRRQIVDRASASVNYLDQAEGQVLSAVVQAYIDGLSASHLVSLVCSGLVILGCTFVNNRQLPG